MLPLFFTCLVIGVVTEALAARLGLWRYRLPRVRTFNVVVIFGGVYGAISYLLANSGMMMLFLVGAGVGLVIEMINEQGVRAWYFPGKSVPWLKGMTAVAVIGTGWGLVPLLAVLMAG